MMNVVIFNTDAILFDISRGSKIYHFQVPNQLLEHIAHFHPNEASEELDYDADGNPSESYAISITEENFHH